MREYYIIAGEPIKLHPDTVWTLWFLAKDSLEEKELNQFQDIFEILKRIRANEKDTKLVKNLGVIMKTLTNRYKKYFEETASQLQPTPVIQKEERKINWETRLNEIKKNYPRAYENWTTDEENELKQFFESRLIPSDIAVKLQRQPSAIRSRLRKLGLIE